MLYKKSPFRYNRVVQALLQERKGDFMAKKNNDLAHTKVQFTRDYTGEVSDGRYAARQIFHVMFKLSLVAAMVVSIKSTTRRLSSKSTSFHVSR